MVLAIISIAGSRLTFLRKKLPYGFRNISLTGTEYIFIGILLGQMGLEFLDSDALFQLNPFLVFGLCWIGFLFGLQFDLRNLKKIPRTFVPITFVQSLFTFTLVSVAMTAALFHFSDMPGGLVIFVALVLGSASSCTAQSAMAVLERSHRIARPRLVTFLRYVSGVDGLWALIFFMVTLSIFPESGRTGIPAGG